MNILENSKVYQLQSDYVNGTGEHGAVHKKYTEIMQQYKSVYAECPEFDAMGLMDLYKGGQDFLKKIAIVDMILIGLSIWGFQGRVIWFIISFIASFVKYIQIELEQPSEDSVYNNLQEYAENNTVSLSTFTGKSGRWFIWPIVVLVFVIITFAASASVFCVWIIYIIPLAIDLYKCASVLEFAPKKAYAANKEKIHKIQQAEKRLEEIRKQLRLLIPELQKEYQEELNLAVSDMNKVERCAALKQYGVLPKQFWWNIDPSQLLEKEMYLKNIHGSFLASHEVDAIGRMSGNEFQNAGSNYAPMYAEQLTEKEMNTIYQKNLQLVMDRDGIVIDFVDCIKYPQMITESEVIKDYDYVENSFMRDFETGQWNSIGEELREAHSHGILTNGEYGCLKNRYDDLDPDVRDYINRKVEVGQHVETFQKYRIFTRYEWTGQALLLPDAQIAGGYILLDYRCRWEYEFDNLEVLKAALPVTQIWADYVSGQQDFIAKVQEMIVKRNSLGGARVTASNNNSARALSIASIALILCFYIPMAPISGIILGVISRKKGGGFLATIGILVNILGLIGNVLVFQMFRNFLIYH